PFRYPLAMARRSRGGTLSGRGARSGIAFPSTRPISFGRHRSRRIGPIARRIPPYDAVRRDFARITTWALPSPLTWARLWSSLPRPAGPPAPRALPPGGSSQIPAGDGRAGRHLTASGGGFLFDRVAASRRVRLPALPPGRPHARPTEPPPARAGLPLRPLRA